MRHILPTIITAAVIFIGAGCEDFSTSYRRIEDTEFRLLDFMYIPADAAPGDTVTLRAVFAGKEADLDSRFKEWWISFNVIRDLFGSTTVADSMLLDTVAFERRYGREFSENTQTAVFRFIIPENIVKDGAAIPLYWTDMLPPEIAAAVPAPLASMTKHEIIDSITAYAENGASSVINAAFLPMLLQYFTVPIRINAKLAQEPGRLPHTIRSNHSVRYNSLFASRPSLRVPINYNPVIDGILVFKVKGTNMVDFHDKTGFEYDTIVLDNTGNSVIEVEKGYSYFLEAVTARSRDLTQTMFGNWVREEHFAYWQFQLDKDEAAKAHHSDYMNITNSTGRLTPPADKNIKKFTLWVTVTDDVMNERLRPQGGTLAEVTGSFVYK